MWRARWPRTIGSTADSDALRPISSVRALRAISVPPEIARNGTIARERLNCRNALAISTHEVTQPPAVWSTTVTSSSGRRSIADSTLSATPRSITGVMIGITRDGGASCAARRRRT
jgi:hypothetical protein